MIIELELHHVTTAFAYRSVVPLQTWGPFHKGDLRALLNVSQMAVACKLQIHF